MIVVDTNVMTHLLMGGEGSADAALLFEQDPEWAAPVILMSELRNVLLGFVRQGGWVPDQAKSMSDDAVAILGDRIATVSSAQVFDIAQGCGLTAYDAEFVALARTLGVPWLRWTAQFCGAPLTWRCRCGIYAGSQKTGEGRR